MAPAKRKRAAADTAPPKKSQKTSQAQPSKVIHVDLDEQFAYDRSGSVYVDEDGVVFDASLNQTNIGNNNNKFYVLQLIQSRNGDRYFTHTRWGRVGETGQTKTTTSATFEEAKKEFEKKFKDKTGLTWDSRLDEPKAKKYTFLEKAYDTKEDTPEDKKKEVDDGSEDAIASKLPYPVQKLLELIFDEDMFNANLEDIGYNKDKLPLGKLGEATRQAGYEALKELSAVIQDPKVAQKEHGRKYDDALEHLSNKYYTVIPHAFGRSKPPIINTADQITNEVKMLDTLTEMCAANSIMDADHSAEDMEKIARLDQRFNDLKLTEMTPLDNADSEYQLLEQYLKESTGSTHGVKYKVEDMFRIERAGERERFTKSEFSSLKKKNKLLLWHGSRASNFGGILSQGLRIAPPEAPVSGYAFGKGVYLADCSSKSANYCCSYITSGTGLLLLCEAELSNPMYEIHTGDSDAQAQAKKNKCISTKGVGRVAPTAWKDAGCVNKNLKGVLMPDGQAGPNSATTGYLQYNEYIAYDVRQVQLRYLIRVKM